VASSSGGESYLLTPKLLAAAKTLGAACDVPGGCDAGDPITLGTGNVFEKFTDYASSGPNKLTFERYYNSLSTGPGAFVLFTTGMGEGWTNNYSRSLTFTPPTGQATSVVANRPDGQGLTFTLNGGTWTTDTDVDYTLTQVGSAWSLKDHNDTVESYNSIGVLQTITLRNGYSQTVAMNNGRLSTVTDSYNRTLTFGNSTTSPSLITTVTTPDGLVLTYGYNSTGVNDPYLDRLASVSYNTTPVTSQTFLYENPSLPFALTGITDENNNRYKTWSYDSQGRGQTSQTGNGTSAADLTTVAYNSDGSTTVTNAFGVADTYKFTSLQGVSKLAEIDRAATSTTAAATRLFTYDTNGYLFTETDWNGNETKYTNNTNGNPTEIDYAVSSPVAYSVSITYDTTFIHLPHIVTAPGVTSTYARDGNGNPLSRTDVDTTTTTVPYSTNGQTRETQWTWSPTGQELSVQLPRTDVVAKTQFGYDSTGSLSSVKDAFNHLTTIINIMPGGLPAHIYDENNVLTMLAYDARLNLHTSMLMTTAGNLVTTWNYDPANNLQSVVKPDGSTLTYGHDTVHRLTSITDLLGSSTTLTLDALGGATLTNITNSSGTVTLTHSRVFDALDRITSDIGGVGQTTIIGYDPMSNVTSITPPSPSGVITQTPDALNRLATRTDPSPGGTTTWTYNPFNLPLMVEDANNHTSSYVYDGFNDRIQTASPDSGTSVFYFNPDRDLTKSVLPGNLTMNASFDADDRPLAHTYTGDTTLSVSRTYDQTGHGFGVGRLTSATDQVGSLSLTYDERANITAESRTVTGAGTLALSTTYDAASNVATETYPSGTFVQYGRDSMGKVTSVTATPPGGSASNVATGVTYEPLPEFAAQGAPPVTGFTFGNGATGAYGYDKDYRPTTRIDAGTGTILKLSYGYFANDSVKKITDFVNAANTQTLNVNAVDELTSATSGTGGYGTLGFTWDPVGNIKTETVNGTTTTYHLATGTNRLSGFVTGSTTENIASSPTGNMTTFKQGTTTLETLAYNKANQLASATTISTSATYEYGLDGRRLEKAQPGDNPILYQYSSAAKELLSENDLHSGTTADYIYLNGRPIGEINPTNGKLYFTHTDRLGTPQTLTDSTQSVAWTTTYQPFGATNLITGPLLTQSLRFPGQQFDPETGYSHNGFRDYADGLTRYVQTDPIGLAGGMNTYQYAGENPFKNIDRRGLCAEDFCVGEIALTTAIVRYAYSAATIANQSAVFGILFGYGVESLPEAEEVPALTGSEAESASQFGQQMAKLQDALDKNANESIPFSRPISPSRGCPTAYDEPKP
jgi:RHS repeat-associated protein